MSFERFLTSSFFMDCASTLLEHGTSYSGSYPSSYSGFSPTSLKGVYKDPQQEVNSNQQTPFTTA